MDNKAMTCLAAKRLHERFEKINPKQGIDCVYKIGLDNSIISDIKESISSDDCIDISDGLFYLAGLLKKFKLNNFGLDFFKFLINILPKIIEINKGTQACYFAIDFYVMLKEFYPNYREKMFSLLESEDLGYRTVALGHYESYAKKDEVEPLIKFQNDPDVSELSMCGPLVYSTRNIALEKICKVTKINFMKNQLKEKNIEWANDYVSWYDWSHFLKWYQKKKR